MSSFIKGLGLDLFDFKGKFISVIEDQYADSSFSASCLIWEALNRPDTGVCLLTIRHGLAHYYHAGMRLGYNLSTVYAHRFLAIDALTIREAHLERRKEAEFCPRIVFENFKSKIDALYKSCKNVFIILDDLSDFLNLGATVKDSLMFIQYLRACFQPQATLIVGSHYHEEDFEEVMLKAYLFQVSDLRLRVKSLETGFSKDVTGSIEMVQKKEDLLGGWSDPVLYHYKARDRSINVFLPGNIAFSY